MNLKSRHIVAAIALHLLLFGLLLGGAQCSHRPEPVNVIQGTLIRADQLPREQADPSPQPPADIPSPEPAAPPPPPKPDPDEARRVQEQQRQQDEQKQKQKDETDAAAKAEQLKQQADAKVAAEKAAELKKQSEADAKKQADADAKKRADATEKKRVEDLQTAAAAEDKKRADDEKKKQAKIDSEAKRLRQAELAEALGAEAEQRKGQEVSIWGTQLQAALQRVWTRPPGLDQTLKCVIKMQLSVSGEVQNASISTSSGNALYDQSVLRAAFKASPLPLPRDPTVFQNVINITFTAQ